MVDSALSFLVNLVEVSSGTERLARWWACVSGRAREWGAAKIQLICYLK